MCTLVLLVYNYNRYSGLLMTGPFCRFLRKGSIVFGWNIGEEEGIFSQINFENAGKRQKKFFSKKKFKK